MLLALGLAVTLVVVRAVGCSAWDLGDGALHYLQARYAHAHVHLYFDQWAKPLYVLLGSPFAQGGPIGMVVFNALIALLTTWGILSIVRPASTAVACLIPLLLFTFVQYARVALSGLTEPLFGLLVIGCLWLIRQDRYAPAMVLLSLMPWSRPEYVAFAPFVLAWVAWHRQWRALPWLLTGATIYFGLGWILLQERIWTFARDPYRGVDFGAGPLAHFVTRAPEVLGTPLLLLALVSLVGIVWLMLRDQARCREHGAVVWSALLPVLGIWAAHTYAYWSGTHASGGLLRVLATTAPLTVLFVAHTADALLRRCTWLHAPRTLAFASGAIGVWAVIEVQHRLDIPAAATTEQQLVERGAATATTFIDPGEKCYTAHPYFPACMGMDMWDTTASHRTWELRVGQVRTGDLVEWDPLYGPGGSHEMFNGLRQHPGFAVIGMDQEADGPWQPPFSIWLFQRTNERQRWDADTLVDMRTNVADAILVWKDGRFDSTGAEVTYRVESGEYPLDIQPLKACRSGEVMDEWILSGRLEVTDGAEAPRFIWVFTTMSEDPPTVTLEQHVTTGVFESRFHQGARLAQRDMRLYLWNIEGHPFVLHDLRLVRRCARPVANVVQVAEGGRQ
jgi:hypothetical protein